MTLSSIVQRESPVNDEDRQLVCGVLINRLNKQMPLQCDVTVNYGNQEVKIDVKHTDLNKDTKYNTYKYNGHVGIYLGNNKFLHCGTSKGVWIDDLNSSYWKKVFNGNVRRVVENN